jgi:hypothetical protein
MNNGEIVYQGTVWKITSTRDGGWRVTLDLPGPTPPHLQPDDLVAVALLKSGDGSPQAG